MVVGVKNNKTGNQAEEDAAFILMETVILFLYTM